MRRIRGTDTRPELAIRSLLHALGYRFKTHLRSLPGRPDIVFHRRKCAIYIHGCFWHGHEGCRIAHVPKTHPEYWAAKFERNKLRDKRNLADMSDLGWKTLVIWECEVSDLDQMACRTTTFLGPRKWLARERLRLAPHVPETGSKESTRMMVGPLNTLAKDDEASSRAESVPLFIDAFSGCGGLSLGLLRSGWHGLFAIEKDAFAFATYKANLLEGRFSSGFHWPSWLERDPTCIEALMGEHYDKLRAMQGKVALLAGGPPCQGFSSAGRRLAADPRNSLMIAYLQMVQLIEPAMVLLENVRGITLGFAGSKGSSDLMNYAEILKDTLNERYDVYWELVNSSEFGVPQSRTRFILVALRRDLGISAATIAPRIDKARRNFLRSKRLVTPTTALAALSDLELQRNGTFPCGDSLGFRAICYQSPRTHYQRLMRDGDYVQPTDTRLARHRPEIIERFKDIISQCKKEGRLNMSIGREMREEYGLKKMALRVLDPDRPAPTITSMPDDLLHYSEPRTLTVRENARLQGFPDWFAFQGKYTTGGDRRRREVPRFTQVANAVPPPLAEVLGQVLLEIWKERVRAKPKGAILSTRLIRSVERNVDKDCYVSEIGSMLDQVAS